MKILLVSSQNRPCSLHIGVDSAMLRHGEPLFVPDNTSEWITLLAPVIRINHLGFNIKATHAKEYYHEATIFHIMLPNTADNTIEQIPGFILDRAYAPGTWHDIADIGTQWSVRAEHRGLNNDFRRVYEDCFNIDTLDIDKTIEWLSRGVTLKTGDLIAFLDPCLKLGSPIIDTVLDAKINGLPTLNFRIK